jgi:hypothetical protein
MIINHTRPKQELEAERAELVIENEPLIADLEPQP